MIRLSLIGLAALTGGAARLGPSSQQRHEIRELRGQDALGLLPGALVDLNRPDLREVAGAKTLPEIPCSGVVSSKTSVTAAFSRVQASSFLAVGVKAKAGLLLAELGSMSADLSSSNTTTGTSIAILLVKDQVWAPETGDGVLPQPTQDYGGVVESVQRKFTVVGCIEVRVDDVNERSWLRSSIAAFGVTATVAQRLHRHLQAGSVSIKMDAVGADVTSSELALTVPVKAEDLPGAFAQSVAAFANLKVLPKPVTFAAKVRAYHTRPSVGAADVHFARLIPIADRLLGGAQRLLAYIREHDQLEQPVLSEEELTAVLERFVEVHALCSGAYDALNKGPVADLGRLKAAVNEFLARVPELQERSATLYAGSPSAPQHLNVDPSAEKVVLAFTGNAVPQTGIVHSDGRNGLQSKGGASHWGFSTCLWYNLRYVTWEETEMADFASFVNSAGWRLAGVRIKVADDDIQQMRGGFRIEVPMRPADKDRILDLASLAPTAVSPDAAWVQIDVVVTNPDGSRRGMDSGYPDGHLSHNILDETGRGLFLGTARDWTADINRTPLLSGYALVNNRYLVLPGAKLEIRQCWRVWAAPRGHVVAK